MIFIVIIDSQEEYRNDLCKYLSTQKDFTIAGIGHDSYSAVKLVDIHKPNIVLMDINLPVGDGIKTAALIKYRSPCTSVIVNWDGKDRRIFSVFFSGVSGYITKEANSELLCHAIRTVYYGGSFVSPEIVVEFRAMAASLSENIQKSRSGLQSAQFSRQTEKQDIEKYSGDSATELLRTISRSEIQIMGFVGQGYTNKEIAKKLCLTEGTIRNYISSVLQKTGFRDRTQVAIYAIKAGL